MSADLEALLRSGDRRSVEPVAALLNGSLLEAVRFRYNSEIGPRRLGRRPEEAIPTERVRLTEFRGRIGTLLEVNLGVVFDQMLKEDSSLRLTFVVNQQYPDFYMRDAEARILLRIDSKLLHDESAEYSARFDLPTVEVDALTDLVMYGAWRWEDTPDGLIYPDVQELLAVPAIDIAEERDRSLHIRGGHIDTNGLPVLPTDKVDTNFGKINRIVHTSRRDASDLPATVREFLDFTQRHADAVRLVEDAEEDAAPRLTDDELRFEEEGNN